MRQTLNAKYWDSVAGRLERAPFEPDTALYYKSEHTRLLKRWAGPLKGKRVLKTDLYQEALGPHQFLFWLLRQEARVFGMDISPAMARIARLRAGEAGARLENIAACDVRACAFQDESFDAIISNSTLDHLPEPDVPRSLAELRRILRPGGVLILTLDNADNPLYALAFRLQKALRLKNYFLGRCYGLAKTRRLAEQNGFAVEAEDAIVHLFPPFTRLVRILKDTRLPFFCVLARCCVRLALGAGRKKTRFFTGWFIALKLRKK